jgi:hypothetical protein
MQKPNKHTLLIGISLIGIVVGLSLPTTSVAGDLADPTRSQMEDGDCKPKAAIALEIDVMTGDVYMVDDTGNLTLTDEEIDVYVGTNARLLVDLQYSTGEWDVEVSPSGGVTKTYKTRGGALRYWMNTAPDEYLLSSTLLSAMMTPVVPDIVLRPRPDCPPST